jgi:GNAT superfamily N-acetyltransferase
MDDKTLLARAAAGRVAVNRALAAASPGARLERVEGVEALVTPAVPERSLPNAATLTGPHPDVGALAHGLAALYRGVRVHAWTVWVPPAAASATTGLSAHGHVLDGQPLAMAAVLDDVAPPDDDGLELDPHPRVADLAALNDAAHGFGDGLRRVLAGAPDDAFRLYVARVDGRPASCLFTIDHEDDCIVELVATDAALRGRGLATGLMRRALAEARDRGRHTSTLIATAKGAPIYERLGYRRLQPIEMWERREAPAGAEG